MYRLQRILWRHDKDVFVRAVEVNDESVRVGRKRREKKGL